MARELPHSTEAEQSILGAMLVYPSLVRMAIDQDLHAEEFYVEAHQRIYRCMMELQDSGQNVDITTLITRLNDTNQLAMVGGADYVIKLSDSAVSSANGIFYIDIIKERYHLRRLIETAEQIAEEGFDSSSSLDDVLDHAEKEILEVTRSRRASEFQSSKEVVNRVIKELVALRESDNHITGVRTGYQDLDRMTNGFQRGDLIILAARPAMGKTALALNLGMYTALRNPGAVAFFSLEMPADSLMKRLLSAKSQVEGNKLRGGNISDEELNRLNEAGNELAAAKIFIDDSASIKVSQIFSKCRKLMSECGLSLIVIDYLQLISGSGRGSGDNRQQEVSEISRNLKILAKEMNCPVIALSQLSRSVEQRTDKQPMLSDLRESGAIEQDADIVMFLYREDYYKKPSEQEERAEANEVVDLNLAKHRNGSVGHVSLVFNKSISAFYNHLEEGGY
ncbi:replicative DNA helicase [Merdibacter massiliensis]|uniref:replicative DNA helicase n=1 Tax=Merdibacter massiliensis TaxID=1871030 RepID=UPI00096A5842|nr:replicative DNA helicase [Merdibacter massiliensis]